MRILFLGDVVGTPGVRLIRDALPSLRAVEGIDFVVANAENASGGSGMYPSVYRQLRAAGVDLVTMGDHVYKRSELLPTMQDDPRICRPANFPSAAPGREWAEAAAPDGTLVAAFCVLGRTFMRPVDCPFAAADRVLAALAGRARIVVADLHAEATADKYLLGYHLRGRVTAALGTHTHVPTADEHVMGGGTAFVCDVGMCGPHDGVLGRRVDRVLSHALTFVPVPFEVSAGDVRLNGAVVEAGADGRALAVRRLTLDGAGAGRLRG